MCSRPRRARPGTVLTVESPGEGYSPGPRTRIRANPATQRTPLKAQGPSRTCNGRQQGKKRRTAKGLCEKRIRGQSAGPGIRPSVGKHGSGGEYPPSTNRRWAFAWSPHPSSRQPPVVNSAHLRQSKARFWSFQVKVLEISRLRSEAGGGCSPGPRSQPPA